MLMHPHKHFVLTEPSITKAATLLDRNVIVSIFLTRLLVGKMQWNPLFKVNAQEN